MHKNREINLGTPALSAFAEGCAHYLVQKISTLKPSESGTAPQFLLALVRIYLSADESSGALKYTVAVALASAVSAMQSRNLALKRGSG
ncbi:hypothetical protein FRC07_012092, partial [Ceratobasidium sp. 392]